MSDRIPPNSLEAEMAVLGALLVDRELIGAVRDILTPEMFYAHVNETIFATICTLDDAGKPFDKISVLDALRMRDMLERVGGASYLSALMDTVQTAGSARYYAQIIAERAKLRGLIHAGGRIISLGFDGLDDVDAAVDEAQQMTYALSEREGDGFVSLSSSMHEVVTTLDTPVSGVSTGIADLDRILGPLTPGSLTILAGRPGLGKSSLALQVATHVARSTPVALVSLEMSRAELVLRMLSAHASVPGERLHQHKLLRSDWDLIGDVAGGLAELPLYIDDGGATTIAQIRTRARRLRARQGLGLIIVDYLQILGDVRSNGKTPLVETITRISQGLKALAKDVHLPVIALSQLSRSAETRADKRPLLSDLRESGAIEQDADRVVMLHRPDPDDPSFYHAIVAKNRNGATGDVALRFLADLTRFVASTNRPEAT